jgi:hypothetical protein
VELDTPAPLAEPERLQRRSTVRERDRSLRQVVRVVVPEQSFES